MAGCGLATNDLRLDRFPNLFFVWLAVRNWRRKAAKLHHGDEESARTQNITQARNVVTMAELRGREEKRNSASANRARWL